MAKAQAADEPPTSDSTPQRRHLPALFGAAITVTILCIALWFLHHELASVSLDHIVQHARSLPPVELVLSFAFVVLSYFVLAQYDVTALHYLGRTLPYRDAGITSFIANAVGYNVGLATLSGGSIRYRMYSALGLSGSEIAQIMIFVTVTFVVGATLLLGVALLLMPDAQTAILHIPPLVLRGIGVLFMLVPVAYLVLVMVRSKPLSIRGWQLTVPSLPIAIAQIGLSVADLLLVSAVLYVLLAPEIQLSFFAFLGIYLLALGAGVISSVPGGIGVFEAVLLFALPNVDRTSLLGTILIYRLAYYIIPLCIALFLLVTIETRKHYSATRDALKATGVWALGVIPLTLGLAVFLAGAVLLISGSIPAVDSRIVVLAKSLPLSVLEISHLLGSVIGVILLILAKGLFRRLRGAYIGALLLLIAGCIASLVKGLDYEEALILGIIAGLLWLSRDEFYRRARITGSPFSLAWFVAVIIVICVTIWIAMLSFQHVEYADKLWWQFALHGDASRTLRALLIAGISALGFAFWTIIRSSPQTVVASEPTDEPHLKTIIAAASDSVANVALMEDKRILWSVDQRAFIMYAVSGKSWVAMGDPVGPPDAQEELVWKFREMVDRHDGRPVFYQITESSLPLYIDMGLMLAKLGEDARVLLNNFSLDGGHRADLRQAYHRARREGATFEIVPTNHLRAILGELRQVSEAWLKDKATTEKGFSLGAFTNDYMLNFDCAIVRVGGAIVAFANLWPAPGGNELSVDLMRYSGNAPKGVMDYLFAELMLWGKARGYTWFNLGMAPLSGLEQHPLAPAWHKFGHVMFSHGGAFYNFEGLRRYKEKFEPVWRSRYIACSGGPFHLINALFDTSRLISGGVRQLP